MSDQGQEKLQAKLDLILQNQQVIMSRLEGLEEKVEGLSAEQKEELEDINRGVKTVGQKVDDSHQLVANTNYVHAGLVAALFVSVGLGLWSGAFQRAAVRFGTPVARQIAGGVITTTAKGVVDTFWGWLGY